MKIVNGTTKAWLGKYSDLSVLKLDAERIIDNVSLSASDMSPHGWTYVGEARVTIEIVDENTALNNRIASLKKEKQTIQAKAQMEANQIDEEIQQLLALGYTEEAPL